MNARSPRKPKRVTPERRLRHANRSRGQGWRGKRNISELCPEALEMLKNRALSSDTFEILQRLTPTRQVEVVRLMKSSADYSIAFARALLAATTREGLAVPDRPKRIRGVSSEEMNQMACAMRVRNAHFEVAQMSYADDVLRLVVACGYVSRLIRNERVQHYLLQRHPQMLGTLRSIVATRSLDSSS
jgi:RepB plasmid partitioning protein